MSKIIKRILLVANAVLLIVISYLAINIVNNRSKELIMPKVEEACAMIAKGIEDGSMTAEQAESAVQNIFKVGDYTPNIRVFTENDQILFETDDPSLVGVSGKDVAVFNCSTFGTS